MSQRGNRLLETADGQISELMHLVSRVGETGLSVPCPGREKLGDGTVGALALHTADSYLRIAAFLKSTNEMSATQPVSHRVSGLDRAPGHMPTRHADGAHDPGAHDRGNSAHTVDLAALLERLSTGRDALRLLADLSDDQLGTVPPAGGFRFCDGQRTLELVTGGLLKHQGHQIDAIKSVLS